MNLASFREWVRQIYATRDDELDCDEVSEKLSEYVDAEVAGQDPASYFPNVRHHLTQCSRCRDLYEGMRDAAQIEENERTSRVSVDVAYETSTSPT